MRRLTSIDRPAFWLTFVKNGKRGACEQRLRRYYLIVRLLPNVFALACLRLSSI